MVVLLVVLVVDETPTDWSTVAQVARCAAAGVVGSGRCCGWDEELDEEEEEEEEEEELLLL